MGKFTGVLIASDFDNTLIYTENALKGLEPMPELLPENRQAIEYFMAQGGTFSIATGRALPSFNGVRQGLPMCGPISRRCWTRGRRRQWSCTTMTTPFSPSTPMN